MKLSCNFYRGGAACLLLSLAMIAGCSKSEPERIVIKLDPPTWSEVTGNGVIKTVEYPGGGIREKNIPYADGSFGQQFYRPDKTLEKTVTYYPPRDAQQDSPPVKAEGAWSKDGKILVLGKVFRPDGSLMYTQENTAEGKRVVTRFLPGNVMFSKTVSNKGTERSDVTYFKPDGSVWKEEKWDYVETSMGSHPGLLLEKEFGAYGNVLWSAEYTYQTNSKVPDPNNPEEEVTPDYSGSNSGKTVSFFNTSGKVTHRQYWSLGYNNCGDCGGEGEEPDQLNYVEVMNLSTDKVETTYSTNDRGTELFVSKLETAAGKTTTYKEGPDVKKVLLEKDWYSYGSTSDRFLHTGTVEKYEEKGATTVPQDKVFDTVDLKLFKSPANTPALQQLLQRGNSESNVDLGSRDDSDPCKWYRRP